MTAITFQNHSSVRLVEHMGGDSSIAQAARVSTGSDSTEGAGGLINYLMKQRHGSPFEQVQLKFEIETPIFVAREFMRHRMAGYNEVSGRYTKLEPKFWTPRAVRPMVNVGTSARPKMAAGSDEMVEEVLHSIGFATGNSWATYSRMIDLGVANEVARTVLPLNIFTKFFVTMNLRGVFNFLSLRVESQAAAYPTHPQLEIQEVAEDMERFVDMVAPLAYKAFVKNGRVCP